MNRKLKLFHALGAYNDIINIAYQRNPLLKNSSYENQKKAIFDAGYGSLNIWKIYYENHPEFIFETCVCNSLESQQKWAHENNLEIDAGLSKREILQKILIKQIAIFQPEVLFAHDIGLFGDIILEIKQSVKSIKFVFGWDGILMHNLKLFEHYDLVLSPVKETVQFYNQLNKQSYFFPFGFHPKILEIITPPKKPYYECTFIGQLQPQGQHSDRFKYILGLTKNFPVNLWVPSLGIQNRKIYFLQQIKRLLKLNLKDFQDVRYLKNRNNGVAYGIDMFQIISESSMVVNKHINQVGSSAANIRLFEVTGIGSCLITDFKENITEYFEPEKEIITYNSIDELISKIKFYNKNEGARESIAKAGQFRTLNEHTYSQRFASFTQYLIKLLR